MRQIDHFNMFIVSPRNAKPTSDRFISMNDWNDMLTNANSRWSQKLSAGDEIRKFGSTVIQVADFKDNGYFWAKF
jgi:hypothetical protein